MKNKDLINWFSFMDKEFKKIEESNQNFKINNILIDNDIDLIN
jgi:hypothetical protein|tara:strand:+ start:625 stop:753 length:129 start_codon:yes stop_codon:yes gene_type:complete